MISKKFSKDDIFKYGGLHDLERTLNDETLGFSNLVDYNDPFESEYSTYLFIKDLEKRANFMRFDVTQKNEPEIWKSYDQIKNWITDHLSSQRVTCFSKSPIEPLMWAHYADKHKGVCYCFDKDVYGNEYASGEVIYSSHLPKLQLLYGSSTSSDVERQLENIILTKSKPWSYEQEFRFYTSLDKQSHRFDSKSLKYVILGMRSSDDFSFVSPVVSEFNKRNGTNVRILHANMASDRYEMEINSGTTERFAIHCPKPKEMLKTEFW